ncbi:MAG TPA: hypothetical protein VI756_19750 [Blastocatellia bacterium]
MAFDWSEFLQVAEFLKDKSGIGFSEEASVRSAIGRAYYAAFCHARDIAMSKGLVLKRTGDDHIGVRDHYKSKGMAVVATKLDALRQWRGSCDYDLDIGEMLNRKPPVVDLAVMHAKYILSTVKPGNR